MENSVLIGHSVLIMTSRPNDLRSTLEAAGAHVRQTTVTAEALDFLNEGEFSASVLDFGLEFRSGEAVARRSAELGLPIALCDSGDLAGYAAWPNIALISDLASGPEIVAILRDLLGREPSPNSGAAACSAAEQIRAREDLR